MSLELNSVTSTTLVPMCVLPLTAILVASEAMAASKRPRRSHAASDLNSVTSITYVPMSLWQEKEAKHHPLTSCLRPK